VRHESLVPKKLEEKGPKDDVYDKNKQAIQALAPVTGVDDCQHYNICR